MESDSSIQSSSSEVSSEVLSSSSSEPESDTDSNPSDENSSNTRVTKNDEVDDTSVGSNSSSQSTFLPIFNNVANTNPPDSGIIHDSINSATSLRSETKESSENQTNAPNDNLSESSSENNDVTNDKSNATKLEDVAATPDLSKDRVSSYWKSAKDDENSTHSSAKSNTDNNVEENNSSLNISSPSPAQAPIIEILVSSSGSDNDANQAPKKSNDKDKEKTNNSSPSSNAVSNKKEELGESIRPTNPSPSIPGNRGYSVTHPIQPTYESPNSSSNANVLSYYQRPEDRTPSSVNNNVSSTERNENTNLSPSNSIISGLPSANDPGRVITTSQFVNLDSPPPNSFPRHNSNNDDNGTRRSIVPYNHSNSNNNDNQGNPGNDTSRNVNNNNQTNNNNQSNEGHPRQPPAQQLLDAFHRLDPLQSRQFPRNNQVREGINYDDNNIATVYTSQTFDDVRSHVRFFFEPGFPRSVNVSIKLMLIL